MKVLVTGASGFVGSTLCEELHSRGLDVHCLLRSTSSLENLTSATFQRVDGDLSNERALQKAVDGAELIFHVAGKVASKDREGFFRANSEGTKNLLRAVESSKQKPRFVYVSSLAAAGPSTPTRARIESDPNTPVSDYGASKLAGEEAVLECREKFPVTIVRPPAVYGPRDKGVFTFFQAIQKGILPLLGMRQAEPRRYSFVHVADLVQGLVLAGVHANSRSGEVFYVAGDGEYTWEEAMGFIAAGMEKQTLSLPIPLVALKGAAFACSAYTKAFGKVLPFSIDKAKEISAPAWTCSNQKAKREWGFEPHWELARGLSHTARWYKENGWL